MLNFLRRGCWRVTAEVRGSPTVCCTCEGPGWENLWELCPQQVPKTCSCLAKLQSWPGLVIGFLWPSSHGNQHSKGLPPTSYPPAHPSLCSLDVPTPITADCLCLACTPGARFLLAKQPHTSTAWQSSKILCYPVGWTTLFPTKEWTPFGGPWGRYCLPLLSFLGIFPQSTGTMQAFLRSHSYLFLRVSYFFILKFLCNLLCGFHFPDWT